jgi:hypothetical protein
MQRVAQLLSDGFLLVRSRLGRLRLNALFSPGVLFPAWDIP